MKIRKNDIVSVIVGKDSGKKGKVLKVFPKKSRAVVEGINFVKRHVRRRREDEPGGIIQRESPIHISNLMLYCNKCSRPVRTGIKFLEDGSKVRVCKRCGESI
jgi:large subunit ribosomal protein L24